MVISIVRDLYQTDTRKRMHDFFVHVLVDRSFKFANKLSCYRNATFCYSVLFLQNFCSGLICKLAHDSNNIDTVTVYLNRFSSYTCHCLLFMEIRYFDRSPFQGLLILRNINMTLSRQILREPVFNGHSVLSGH